MAEKTSTVRKNIRDLSNPLELRELNRQLEWIWRKILGGLDERAFSDGGIRQLTTTVEKIVSTDITADTIDTNFLNAAIAKMMVAVIGVCDVDYLNAVDANVENLIVRRGLGNSFTFDNLKIIYAQIVSATIGELCVKASDGNYYTLDVDSDGKVTASMTTVADGEIAVGHTNAGKVILGTDIVAEELSTSDLFATFALVDKIDASRINVDTLVARAAFTEKLFATEAFVDALYTSKIYGGKSLEIIAGEASDALGKIDNVQIGGRNLLLKSATKKISAYANATLAFKDGVSVAEWGATDAIHCKGTGGTSVGFATLGGVSVNNTSVLGQDYVHSIYIRNDGKNAINITNNNLGSVEYIQSGESRRVVLKNKGNGAHIQFNFRTATAGDEIDITYWHPKIELGNVATDWTPAPEDNAEIFTGDNPPALPIKTGTLWIDTGVSPTVIRRWKGTGTSTDRDEEGWDTVSDLEEINDISSRLIAQQAEAQKAIDQLATAITIDTSGAHFYKPGYRDRSEVRIDQNSVDILVGGNVNSSFIAGGLILGNYMLWHPTVAGGLAFNLA